MPVEILLIAILVSTFIFEMHEVIFITAVGGLVMDYFSVLPFGVIVLAMILSVALFILYKRNFSLNKRTFFVSLISLVFVSFIL